jgi:general stress protein CsbA
MNAIFAVVTQDNWWAMIIVAIAGLFESCHLYMVGVFWLVVQDSLRNIYA